MTAPTPILLTGGSGYIASWIIFQLLEKGHTVRASVRDLSNDLKVKPLKEIAQKAGSGKLELFEADLLKEGSFTKAMESCEWVLHTASPFKNVGVKNPQKELVDPALLGTKNILNSANETSSVKRVVLTSSVVATFGDNTDCQEAEGQIITEKDWNRSSSLSHRPYAYSKTVAEKAAWEMAGQQDKWDLVVINPGFVLGPTLLQRKDSTSIDFMESMMKGKFKMGMPELYFAIVDVRDVAKAHILAASTPTAKGRHITMNKVLSTLEIAQIIQSGFDKKLPLPGRFLPKFLVKLFGPLQGFSRKFVERNVGIPLKMDNSYVQKDLGLTFRPMKETLVEQAKQIMN